MMMITEVGRHAGDQASRSTVSEILEKSNFVLKSKEITIGILISTYSVKQKRNENWSNCQYEEVGTFSKAMSLELPEKV